MLSEFQDNNRVRSSMASIYADAFCKLASLMIEKLWASGRVSSSDDVGHSIIMECTSSITASVVKNTVIPLGGHEIKASEAKQMAAEIELRMSEHIQSFVITKHWSSYMNSLFQRSYGKKSQEILSDAHAMSFVSSYGYAMGNTLYVVAADVIGGLYR